MIMLQSLESMSGMPAVIFLLIHLFTSFGKLNGIELPLKLLHEDGNGPKTMEFARGFAFTSDNGVEVPPNGENKMELSASKGFSSIDVEANDDLEYDSPIKSEIPKWLQMQLQSETQQHPQSKHSQSDKHYHGNHQTHRSITSSATASPIKRCSIEISSKIPGICQTMGSIGNACISGDYIDVFSTECL